MTKKLSKLGTNITPTEATTLLRTFLPSEFYLPEWARNTEFFRCMIILLDYLQNSLKDISNPKYAMIEQAYKDIGFKYKNILQTSEESLRSMLIENGFSKILEVFKLSLEQLQMLTLYLPLLKIMKGTDVGYRLFLSLFADEYQIETWLDNPQELDEYTFNILFVSWINVGLSSDMLDSFVEFSRSYVYPILKKVEMGIKYKSLTPAVYGYPRLKFDISTQILFEPPENWTEAIQVFNLGNRDWSSIAYNDVDYVALSKSGYTSTSFNGTTWTSASNTLNILSPAVSTSLTTVNDTWNTICYDSQHNIFVTLGYSNGFYGISVNGEDWSTYQNSLLQGYRWFGLAFNGDRFVALDYNGYVSIGLYDDNSNTISWESPQKRLPLPNTVVQNVSWEAMIYADNKFIAIGSPHYTAISSDGINWSLLPNSNLDRDLEWSNLGYDGTHLVAISYDGYVALGTIDDTNIDWSPSVENTDLGNHSWGALTYTGEKFILLGDFSYISESEDGEHWLPAHVDDNLAFSRLWYSIACNYTSDEKTCVALSWTGDISLLKNITWNSVFYNGEMYVALGNNGYITTSLNGASWSKLRQNATIATMNNIVDVSYNNTNFILLNNDGTISTSTDGTTWTSPTRITNLYNHYIQNNDNWSSIVYDGTKFIAISEAGYISTSENGTTWTLAVETLPDYTWISLVYDTNKVVAISETGYISTLKNGESTWSNPVKESNLGENSWSTSIYNGNEIIVLSSTGYISESTNSSGLNISWALAEANEDLGDNYWEDIVFVDDKFIAVSSTGYLSFSLDGVEWSEAILINQGITLYGITCIAYSKNSRTIIGLTADGDVVVSWNKGASWDEQHSDALHSQYGWASLTYYSSINKFVGLTYSGYISISQDSSGALWTTPQSRLSGLLEGSWISIASNNSIIVAISDLGYISTSEDGTNWSEIQLNGHLSTTNANAWRNLKYINGKFIAISKNGYTSTSVDGIEWTTPKENANLENSGITYWTTLAYGNGRYVAITSEGAASYSLNTILPIPIKEDWSYAVQNSTLENSDWSSIIYDDINNRYLAFSNFRPNIVTGTYNNIAISNNGTNWSSSTQNVTLSGYNWKSIVYGNNKFVVIANTYTTISSDGTIWSPANYTNIGQKIWGGSIYNNSNYITIGSIGDIAKSTDGINWSITSSSNTGLGNHSWCDIAYGNSKFVAIGSSGYGATSSNGTSWTNVDFRLSSYQSWTAVAFGNGRFLTIGEKGYMKTSTDGLTWPGAGGDGSIIGDYSWSGLAYGDNKFVAISATGYISIITYSNNAWHWTTPTQNSDLGSNNWRDITYDGSKFIAFGKNGHVSSSDDGLSWSTASTALVDLQNIAVTYDSNGTCVGISSNGYELKCTNGTSWDSITVSSNLGNHDWSAITYGNGAFVALGKTGYRSSSNGTSWISAVQDSDLGNNTWAAVAYGNGVFVALSSTGRVSTSSSFTGQSWSTAVFNSDLGNNDWKALIFKNDTFIAISTTGLTSMSIDGTSWTPASYSFNLGDNDWTSLAYNANNSKLIALSNTGYLSSKTS